MNRWISVRLEDVAEVFNGKTPSKAEQRNNGHPVLKIKDVTEHGQFKGAFESFVDYELAAKHRNRWIRCGDILVLNAAHNADYVASKLYFADDSMNDVLPTGEWLLVRPNEARVLPGYVNYWFRTPSTKREVKFLVKGIHLYPKDVAKLEIPLPPIDEQRRIIDLLSRVEGIVRLRREAQKKAAEIIPALFLDMFGDPATNPKDWDVVSLGDVFAEPPILGTMAKPSSTGGTWLDLRVANIQGGELTLADKKWLELGPCEVERFSLRVGDILLARAIGSLDHLGKAVIVEPSGQWTFDSHLMRIRLDKCRMLPSFLKAFLESASGREEFLKHTRRSAVQFNINGKEIRKISVLPPPVSEQGTFARRCQAVSAVMVLQGSALHRAEAAFNALLARAFSEAGQARGETQREVAVALTDLAD